MAGYSYKQRADKGFDFYNDRGKKIFLDDYVKATGANKNQLINDMAKAGDKVSIAASSPSVKQYNSMDVYGQRKKLADLQGLANRNVFKTQGDIDNRNWALNELTKLQSYGTNKGGNPLTFAQDLVKGTADTYGRVMNANARALDRATLNTQGKLDESRLKTVNTGNQILSDLNNKYAGNKVALSPSLAMSPTDRRMYNLANNAVRNTQATLGATTQQITDQADPIKYAGASGSVALDALTAGAGSQAIKNSLKGGAPLVQRATQAILNPQTIKQGVASGATLGAGYGITGTAEQLGGQATLQDYAKGAALGGVTGGVLGGALPSTIKAIDAARKAAGIQTRPERAVSSRSANEIAVQKAQTITDESARNNPQVVNARELVASNQSKIQDLLNRGFSPNSPDVRALQRQADVAEQFARKAYQETYDTLYPQRYEAALAEANTVQRQQMRQQAGADLRGLNREVRELVPGGTLDSPIQGGRKAEVPQKPFERQLQENQAKNIDQLQQPQKLLSNTTTTGRLEETLSNQATFDSKIRSSADSIPQQTLKLTPGQAKQRFRKLNRDGTSFEIVNDLDKNAKTPKTNIVDSEGVIKKGGTDDIPELDFSQFKDRPALLLNRETLERNLDSVAGKQSEKLKEYLVDSSRKNETDRIKFINSQRKSVKEDVIKKLGIKPKSKRSELVQRFGEGEISLEQLKAIAPNDWRMVEKGSRYFRKQYDELLDRWNAVRQQYGYEPIPKRKDYFRHFIALDNASSIVGTIKNARDLPTSISGITDIFKPNAPFSDATLARTGNKTTYDAVSGFDNYIDSISKQIFHTDTVQRGREVVKAIRQQAEIDESKAQLPNFVATLDEWTNLIAGKKSRIDRAAESLIGRKVYAGANAIQRQVSRNMIGYNLGSALTAAIPLTQSLATTNKIAAVKGLASTLISPFKPGSLKNIDGVESSFLIRRFPSETFSKGKVDAVIRAGYLPMQAIDMFSSRAIVSGKYFENLQKGMSKVNAMKAADEYAGKVITDRSGGQMPNIFKAQTPGPITQFMAEVNNQLSFVLKDMPKQFQGNPAKIAYAAGQMAVYAYLFNEAFEAITGRRVAVDPIDFVRDMADSEQSEEQKWESFKQNILNAIPGSGLIADSGRLPISAAFPDGDALGNSFKSLQENNLEKASNQFVKGVSGPLFYSVPPTGGGQIKKMLDAGFNQSKGYSETPGGSVRFTAPSDPLNISKSFVFGQYASDQGKQYIKDGINPLGENQSDVYKKLREDMRQDYLNTVRGKSERTSSQAIAELEKQNQETKAKFEASFSPEDYELYSLSKDERQQLINQGVVTEEKFKGLDGYAKDLKKKLGMTVASRIGETKLDKNSTSYKFLDSIPEMTDDEKKSWKSKPVAVENQGLIDRLNSYLPEGLPKFSGSRATNEVAEMFANFQKNKADKGWSSLQARSEEQKLLKEAYKTQLTDNEKFITGLSDKDVVSAVENGEVSAEEIDNIDYIDSILNRLGLSPMLGNSARRKLGLPIYSNGSSGGGGGRKKGGVTQADIAQLTSLNKLGTSTASTLLDLLGKTTVKRTSAPQTQKVTLKKIQGA